jgi:hypothetical protein
LRRDDPQYNNTAEALYWFSSNRAVAMSHAAWYKNASGEKWKLLLRCLIPANSIKDNVHNFRDVQAGNIVMLEKIWFIR